MFNAPILMTSGTADAGLCLPLAVRCAVVILTSLSLAIAGCSRAVSPQDIARQLVEATDRRSQVLKNLENLKSAPPKQFVSAIEELFPAFEDVLGHAPQEETLRQLLSQTNELYPDGKTFAPSVSSQLAGRVKAISKDRLKIWTEAVTRLERRAVDKENVLLLMIRQPEMFDSTALKEEKAERQLKRFQSIPAAAATKWAAATSASPGVAAFALIQVNALFENTAFLQTTFDEVLPHAERLIKDVDKN